MKRIILSSFLALSLLTACNFGKYSEVKYNNRVVTAVNEASLAIEESASVYNETVPKEVTEETEINVDSMKDSQKNAKTLFDDVDSLKAIQSQNTEQETAVRTELEIYLAAGEAYFTEYQAMLDYYETGAYKEDVTQVSAVDNRLHTAYTTFIEANNDLVDVLSDFVE